MGLRERIATVVDAVRGDGAARYLIAERVAAAIHPQAILSDLPRAWMDDAEFASVYRGFRGPKFRRTMDRVYLLDQLARCASDLEGDTAECGAFDGLSSYMMCRRTQPGRIHHVFDSFEGVSEPGERDGDHWKRGDMSASEDDLRRNLAPFEIEVHRGWIPDRFADVEEDRFSMVHIDVDLYQPTKDSIAFFYGRLVPGALMVFDDYGFSNCPGARLAVDEYFADKSELVLDLPTGQGLVVKRA